MNVTKQDLTAARARRRNGGRLKTAADVTFLMAYIMD